MTINVLQINQQQLIDFIASASSGSAFSGNFQGYLLGSGWLGPNVVDTTGGNQLITGIKTFLNAPLVPYSTDPLTAASVFYVNSQSQLSLTGYSGFANNTFATFAYVTGVSGALAVNGGGVGTGYSGYVENTFVHRFGDEAITGVKTFVNNPLVVNPSFPSGVTNILYVSGVSGVLIAYNIAVSGALQTLINAGGGGGGTPNVVTTTGNEIIGGFKQFTGSPFVPNPSAPSGAANRFLVTGISGVLVAQDLAISGVLQAAIASSVPNVFNLSGITGNFVNMSFFLDQYSLTTGLNAVESFVSRDFFFTGYALGVINTGTQGVFTGSFYQRTPTNIKTNFISFSLNSGMFFSGNGGFNQTISGLNRVGLDIYGIGTGITGLTVGLFGVGF